MYLHFVAAKVKFVPLRCNSVMSRCVAYSHALPSVTDYNSQLALESMICLAYGIVTWHHHNNEAVTMALVQHRCSDSDHTKPHAQAVNIQLDMDSQAPCRDVLARIESEISGTTPRSTLIDEEGHGDLHSEDRSTPLIAVGSADGSDGTLDAQMPKSWLLRFSFTDETVEVTGLAGPLLPAPDYCYMERIARQTLKGLISLLIDREQPVHRVDILHPEDEAVLRKWNVEAVVEERRVIHEEIETMCQEQPKSQAVCAWDGNLSYEELSEASSLIARDLIKDGVRSGSVVTKCVGKGAFVVVAMLAVLKTGATFVLLDVSLPADRKQKICSLVQSKIVIADKHAANSLSSLG